MCWEPTAGSILDFMRKLWYKTDKKYFESNEQSIDLGQLKEQHQDKFELIRSIYGGNFAYLFVHSSMAFRIPPGLVKYYAPILMPVDRFFQFFQTKKTSCWVLALFQKK